MSASFLTCHYLHATGKRCGSPALRGEQFCFYHHPTRRPPARTRPSRTPFDLPPIIDAETLQIALSEVSRRLADNTLDPKRAGLLLLTLQMAKANLPAIAHYLCQPDSPLPEPDPNLPDLSELLTGPGLHPTLSAPGRWDPK
jgi:hypothetical protein